MEFRRVSSPDLTARREAVARHAVLIKPAASLGRLEELGVWLAACQRTCPPRPFTRPRVVVFAGDHGVAAHGVSAYPREATAQLVGAVLTGGAAVSVLAGVAGATVRVVDIAVDADLSDLPDTVSKHKVRRSSGSIDVEDALTSDEVETAVTAGRDIADDEIDSGADVLVAGDIGVGSSTPAAVLVAALTGHEPVAVVGRGSGIDDDAWMRKVAVIRDALRRSRPVSAHPAALLRTVAGADLAAIAGFLAQAAVRRTPVILDGLTVAAAALVAEEFAPGAREWWVAGQRSPDPAHGMVLDHLQLAPLLDLDVRLGQGAGGVAALPLLQMAAHVLAGMATHEEAGVATAGPASSVPPPDLSDAT